MKTRLLCLAFVFALAEAAAQPRSGPATIGVVFYNVPMSELQPADPTSSFATALIEGLAEKGWVRGKNLRIHWRSSEGRYEKLPTLIGELHRAGIDVLVASGNDIAAESIKHSPTTPVVLGSSDYPVENGLAKSLSRPGGNITGMRNWIGTSLNAKRLALLKELFPAARKVAVFRSQWSPDNPPVFSTETKGAANRLGLELVAVALDRIENVDQVFDSATRSGANAILVSDYPFAFIGAAQSAMAAAAIRHRIPVLHSAVNASASGALAAFGPDVYDNFRRAGHYVDRILRGARAGDLPITQPDKLDLIINTTAAKAIGLQVPPSVLLQATRVVGD